MNSYLTGVIVAVALISGTVNAANININATPQETQPFILHNVFHAADSNGGQSGPIVAWFDLDTTKAATNFWNPVTGAFSININIFPDNSLTGTVGTAVGTGNLSAAAFNGLDGGLIGSISWDFDTAAEGFDASGTGNGLADTTMSFYDINYITSASGSLFNSTVGTYDSMALWGANGSVIDPNTGLFNTNTTSLGVDLVATFVPVPAAVWLFGSGLLGLVGVARRRTQQP